MPELIIQKSPPPNRYLSNQSTSNGYQFIPLVTNNDNPHWGNTSKTFDGYTYKSADGGMIKKTLGDISSKTRTSGLRLYTDSKAGTDRDLWQQFYNKSSGPLTRNVIGYTGMWRPIDSGYHFRLEMLGFHYVKPNGSEVTFNVTNNLHGSYNSSNGYWHYGNTGSQNVKDWHIAYWIGASRANEVVSNGYMLCGMSMQIRMRTPTAGTGYPDSYFWNFCPIMSDKSSGNGPPVSINLTNAKAEEGQIIYSRSNTGKNPANDEFKIS